MELAEYLIKRLPVSELCNLRKRCSNDFDDSIEQEIIFALLDDELKKRLNP
jgi:hypothetical protein